MPSQVRFIIPGRVAGKGRPRAFVRGGKIGTYTPEKTRSAEAMVRTLGHEAMAGRALLAGPVAFEMRVYLIPPQSWSRKKREAATYVTGKPDCDNQIKTVLDGLSHIVYVDDAQVAKISFERWYTLTGPERVEITVHDLSAAPFTRMERAAA